MGRTEINVGAVIGASSQINSAKSSVSSAKSSFSQTGSAVDSRIKDRSNIRGRINTVNNRMANIEKKIVNIRNTVESGANRYQSTDVSVEQMRRDINSASQLSAVAGLSKWERYFFATDKHSGDNLKDLPFGSSGAFVITKEIFEKIKSKDPAELTEKETTILNGLERSGFGEDFFGKNQEKKFLVKTIIENGELRTIVSEDTDTTKLSGEADIFKLSDKTEKAKEKLEQKLKDNDLYHEDKDTEYYDENGKKIKESDAPDFYERKATVAEISKEAKASVSAYNDTYKNWLGGELEVTVAEAEAHAMIAGGLYVMGADGEKFFSPGVSAEIGASVTVLNAEYEAQIVGNEYLGVNADAELTVLQAEAKAETQINFFGTDEKGNVVFDPNASVGFSADAVLAEAEGSVGVNVLGGEVELKGSVKVGVGVNADIGYQDGVIKCEIGASLGLGFDVGFEVDVGGMVNTVADAASSAWEAVGDWFGW